MDILKKIEDLQLKKGWTLYRLSEEAGLTQSTLSNMFLRKTMPSLRTLEGLCYAFGITMSQFFLEEEKFEILTKTESEILNCVRNLSKKKQLTLLEFLK